MALINLKSNLSWYGTTPPGPYKTNTDKTDTKFKGIDDIPFVESSGYGNDGSILSPVSKYASDSFIVDDVTFSDRGLASRKAQLGSGTLFDVGNHNFDITRTGFNDTNKYSDSFGITHGNAGLANTYTSNSPIDDMYNKFNLRQDAHDPYGYAKPPFILRGIQREDNSDPQRWGTPGVFNIPRGGPVTAAERAAVDAVRIGKFLIRPPGLSFLTKQFGLQLTNPNVEGPDGTAKTGTFLTKIYDPLSPIANAVGGTLGLRTDRNFPPIVRSPLTEYEDIFKARKPLDTEVVHNRLFKLRQELLGAGGGPIGGIGKILSFFKKISTKVSGRSGESINTLTGLTGPGSLLGIGSTTIRRYISSPDLGDLDSLANNRKDVIDKETNKTTSTSIQDFRTAKEYVTDLKNTNLEKKILENDYLANGNADTKDNSGIVGTGKKYYKTNSYKEIKITAAGRDPNTIAINDFRNGEEDAPVTYDLSEENNPLVKKTTEPTPIKPHINSTRHETPFDGGGLNTSIEGYKSLAYPNLKREGFAMKKSFSKNEDYDNTNSLMVKYGIDTYQADPIQNIESLSDYDAEGAKDLIKFKFTPLRLTDMHKDTESPIIFRAFLNNVNDSFQPSWDEKQDQGRADAKIMMNGWARSISLNFIVPVMSKAELNNVWTKLDELAKLTYPIYAKSGFTGTYTKVTIGDLYNGIPMYVQSLDYDWDNETPWELDAGRQVPLYTNVNMTLGWIGIQRPDYNVAAFSFQPKTSESEGNVAPGTITYGNPNAGL